MVSELTMNQLEIMFHIKRHIRQQSNLSFTTCRVAFPPSVLTNQNRVRHVTFNMNCELQLVEKKKQINGQIKFVPHINLHIRPDYDWSFQIRNSRVVR